MSGLRHVALLIFKMATNFGTVLAILLTNELKLGFVSKKKLCGKLVLSRSESSVTNVVTDSQTN